MNLSKIDISDLLKSGVGFEKNLKISKLLNNFDNKFSIKSPITGSIKLTKIGSDKILTTCNLKIILELMCDRCVKNFLENIKLTFSQIYNKNNKKTDNEEFKIENNNTINLLRLIEQEILLNLPHKILCDKECKGLCNQCGKDLNLENCNCKNRNS